MPALAYRYKVTFRAISPHGPITGDVEMSFAQPVGPADEALTIDLLKNTPPGRDLTAIQITGYLPV